MTDAGLRAWLQYLRIDKYFDTLSAHGHDARSLAQLTDAELAALGLPLGPRKKILLNAGLILQSCCSATGGTRQTDGGPGPRAAAGPLAPSTSPTTTRPPQPQQRQLPTPASTSLQVHQQQQRALQPRPQQQASVPRPNHELQCNPQLKPGTHPGAPTALHAPTGAGHVGQGAVPVAQARLGAPAPARTQQPGGPSADRRAPQHEHFQHQQQPVIASRTGTAEGVVAPEAQPQRSDPPMSLALGDQAPAQHRNPQQQRQQPLLSPAGAPIAPGTGHRLASPSHPTDLPLPKRGPQGATSVPAGVTMATGAARLHSSPTGQTASPAAGPSTAAIPIAEAVAAAAVCAEARPLMTPAAAAERWALARLYPHRSDGPHHRTRASGAPSQVLGSTAEASNAVGCGGADSRGGEAAGGVASGMARALGSGRRCGVLKRSRSWDGGGRDAGDAGGRPCPGAWGAASRGAMDAHQPGAGGSGRRQLSAAWVDGQALYSAAASAEPVDCSFRPLRRAAAAASAREAAAGQNDLIADQPAQPLQQAASAGACQQHGGTGMEGDRRLGGSTDLLPQQQRVQHHRGEDSTVATQRYHSGGGGGGTGDTSQRNTLAADWAAAQLPQAAAAAVMTNTDGGGDGGSSLMDDPRNYETPELLAQLLYDDAAPMVPEQDKDGGGFGADGGQGQRGGGQQPGGGGDGLANGQRVGAAGGGGRADAAGVGEASGRGGAVDAGQGGSERVSREQRLARLRALREEVAATERLLTTLRRMVADEEAALATDAVAAAGGGGRAGLPALAGAARQPPPGPPRTGATRPDAHASASARHRCQAYPPPPEADAWPPQQQQQQSHHHYRHAGRGQAQATGQALAAFPAGREAQGKGGPDGEAGARVSLASEAGPPWSREPSPDPEELPATQRWDSGMMLAERLDLLA